ncbi:heme o synthase [Limnochorda pilosa]|uniref:Protoheme IX farnesyltransferase n=1 Tax=Limnochorda pilosa TaxID=1555112 RepID=A0A0K2SFT5_LIMPI|nr:heme o synthase [Limnochorda pilosa]BAS25966.1 protoheme IX farnesyltransferase [Limnochorda pilosa]
MREITAPLAAASVVRPRASGSLRDYLAVTKPRHVIPSTLTAWIGMALALDRPLPAGLVVATLAGTALAVAASHVFNAVLDRDLDALMERTRDRPLPAGRIRVLHALAYATGMAVAALAVVAWGANGLAALLTLGGILFYAGVYTYWLKRRTPWNTLVGGVAGGIPPLIGWAAATGTLSWPAAVLFLIMVVWQPLHFFALSLLVADDYRRAGFPMVVAVQGEQATLNQIAVYSAVLLVLSVLLHLVGVAGATYLAVALVLGAVYVGAALRAVRGGPEQARFWGRWLLRYALVYLTVLLIVAVLDRTV